MSFLSLSGVCKSFGAHNVVKSVSLDVSRGEFFALLGPSGCGKTTLLRMIAGFETPDAGTIKIDGEVMNAVPAHLRPTNMVFQSYAIFPHLDVFDNIAYGLRKFRLSKDQLHARIQAMLATVRLDGLSQRRADQLSGGQRQRVALARALVREPKLLLLDEPLGALDQRLRQTMQVELRAIQRQVGVTFLLVTHDQQEALSLSDRVAVMQNGCILQVSSPRELYERPACRQVAEFIGETNVFHASMREIGEEAVTVNAGVLGLVSLPRANLMADIGLGEHMLLAIRPEHIHFADDGVAGEIIGSTFFGERSLFQVKIQGRSQAVLVSSPYEPDVRRVHLRFATPHIIGLKADD